MTISGPSSDHSAESERPPEGRDTQPESPPEGRDAPWSHPPEGCDAQPARPPVGQEQPLMNELVVTVCRECKVLQGHALFPSSPHTAISLQHTTCSLSPLRTLLIAFPHLPHASVLPTWMLRCDVLLSPTPPHH